MRVELQNVEAIRARLAERSNALRYAIATGINRTMAAIEQWELNKIEEVFDRPTAFTNNALVVKRASKANLQTSITVKSIQAKYLKWQIAGGTLPTIIEPIDVDLDQYGNIRGKRKGLAGIAAVKRGRFVATINGKMGVWEHRGGKLMLLALARQNRPRRSRYDFIGVGVGVAEQRLRRDVIESIQNEFNA